jgi:hypothetical protein
MDFPPELEFPICSPEASLKSVQRGTLLEQFHNWCIPASTGAEAHLFLNLNAGLKAGSSTVWVQQLWNSYSVS